MLIIVTIMIMSMRRRRRRRRGIMAIIQRSLGLPDKKLGEYQ